jgi:hypothetical protein
LGAQQHPTPSSLCTGHCDRISDGHPSHHRSTRQQLLTHGLRQLQQVQDLRDPRSRVAHLVRQPAPRPTPPTKEGIPLQRLTQCLCSRWVKLIRCATRGTPIHVEAPL